LATPLDPESLLGLVSVPDSSDLEGQIGFAGCGAFAEAKVFADAASEQVLDRATEVT
jgi:hypothetical protein